MGSQQWYCFKGPGPLQFNVCQSIYTYNPNEIKSFYPKTCLLRPSSNLFMNAMQQPATDLTYGTVPGAQIRLFFWSSPVFGKKILRKSQSARGPT